MPDHNIDKRELSPQERSEMGDLIDGFVSVLSKSETDFNIQIMALVRTLAYTGTVLYEENKVSKRHFVASIVESLSEHYDQLLIINGIKPQEDTND